MKATTRLALWLGSKKKSYADGVQIFKELAVNPDRNKFYSTPVPDKMQLNMLLNDLNRYARIHKIKAKSGKQVQQEEANVDAAFQKVITPTAPTQVKSSGRVSIFTHPTVDIENLPEDLQALYHKFKGWYTQYDTKRLELQAIPKDAENNPQRKEKANEIINTRGTIRSAWDEIDNWSKSLNDGPNDIKNPSGKLTKVVIENIKDPEVKALSKKLRIDANFKYIMRNPNPTKEKAIKQLELRKKELIEWDPEHAKKFTEDK